LGARLAIVARGPHLDELVGLESTIDFHDDGVAESLVADDDDWAELVGLGTQFAAAGG
jgi:hypothetical protein